MGFMLYGIFWLVSFGASIIGAICGIGGGVIIKPVLDAFGVLSVATISFLSGCTVLAMSCYNVLKGMRSGESKVDTAIGVPLAVSAAVGGICGKMLFQWVAGLFPDPNTAGAVQAGCLMIATLGTLLYTLNRSRIGTRNTSGKCICIVIGFCLGVLSSFLGIGGGPFNLAVLFYFFSMGTKQAAQNSLYIILYSQAASLIWTILTGTVPEFPPVLLLLMVLGGILGAAAGRSINRRIDDKIVDRLFAGLMIVIIGINLYNIWKFI